jgi:hypothetical protein
LAATSIWAFLGSVRLIRAQPHAARVRWWPWAKFTIARALVIEEVTEEQDLRQGKVRVLI